MLQKKRIILTFRSVSTFYKRYSNEAQEAKFEGNQSHGFYHPADRTGSVSAMIIAKQSALQLWENADIVVPERRLPIKVTPRAHIITQDNQYTKLAEMITPLWKVPYKKQLNIKYLRSVDFLKSLIKKLGKRCVDLDKNQFGLPCDLNQSIPSPKWRGYRNTDEFLVHVGVDRFSPTVGYCLGNPKELEKTVCIGPNHLTNVKPEHKEVAQLFQDYIQKSVLPVTEDLNRNHWRKLLVRSNHRGQIVISAAMHPQRLTQSDVDREKRVFVQYFTEGPGSELDLSGIYFQTLQEDSLSCQELLWGDPYLEEVQGDLKLRVCPLTSLLENSAIADNLFQVMVEAADLKPDSTLLDISCGAGAISLHLSRLTNRVIGVKRTPGKIETVYFNAESNGVSNVNFTQRALPTVLKQLKRTHLTDLVAIINPSEHFLTRHSMILLKNIKALRKIVYVTDQLDGRALSNILLMCQTSGRDYDGPQFFPVKAVPVDIYPQTNSYYFVIAFEKYSPG